MQQGAYQSVAWQARLAEGWYFLQEIDLGKYDLHGLCKFCRSLGSRYAGALFRAAPALAGRTGQGLRHGGMKHASEQRAGRCRRHRQWEMLPWRLRSVRSFSTIWKKGTIMKNPKYLIPLCLALLLGACAPGPNSRSTGQALDDASITTRVKTQIAKNESFGKAMAIDVDTYRGVVSLSGFVDNTQQASEAVKTAKQVAGVERVINNLHVKPQATGSSGTSGSSGSSSK
ncbi:BON domain-containing protein [Noviherbaspirillum sp.]|uniref:BON domain-containing protein n=1 Tax=Noviherbaspirillum sp. TaxID=1926288 RepID=UPI002B4828C7|nr:BON domain-containing protein [Noviherbaspirillum sp.]